MYTNRFVKIRILSTERGGGAGWGAEFPVVSVSFHAPPLPFLSNPGSLVYMYMVYIYIIIYLHVYIHTLIYVYIQCVAVCCSVLQCVAVHCRVL